MWPEGVTVDVTVGCPQYPFCLLIESFLVEHEWSGRDYISQPSYKVGETV